MRRTTEAGKNTRYGSRFSVIPFGLCWVFNVRFIEGKKTNREVVTQAAYHLPEEVSLLTIYASCIHIMMYMPSWSLKTLRDGQALDCNYPMTMNGKLHVLFCLQWTSRAAFLKVDSPHLFTRSRMFTSDTEVIEAMIDFGPFS